MPNEMINIVEILKIKEKNWHALTFSEHPNEPDGTSH
jgi:hypothetical protein